MIQKAEEPVLPHRLIRWQGTGSPRSHQHVPESLLNHRAGSAEDTVPELLECTGGTCRCHTCLQNMGKLFEAP